MRKTERHKQTDFTYNRTDAGIKSQLIRGARRRAAKAGESFKLTVVDIPTLPTRCPYRFCGVLLTKSAGRVERSSYSIDKVDPTKPYDNNWEIICLGCNWKKSNATAHEHSTIAKHQRDYARCHRIVQPPFVLDLEFQ